MTDFTLRAPEFEVTFYGSAPHYRDHLWPVFKYATDHGHLWSWSGATRWDGDDSQLAGQIVVVAAHRDLLKAHRRGADRIVLMQHGAGQSYSNRHSSYPGGRGHHRASLALMPNEQAADRHRKFYPNVPVEVVGCPRLDEWAGWCRKPKSSPPMVVIGWHWRCNVAREAGTAWGDYGLEAVAALVAMRDQGTISLAVHAHPWITDEVQSAIYGNGWHVPFIESFTVAAQRADVLVHDNSSSMFEFAALDRPVVVMNSPRWSRKVRHGGRFWDWAGIGPNIDSPDGLQEAILGSLRDDPHAEARRGLIPTIYPHLGAARERATAAIAALEAQ